MRAHPLTLALCPLAGGSPVAMATGVTPGAEVLDGRGQHGGEAASGAGVVTQAPQRRRLWRRLNELEPPLDFDRSCAVVAFAGQRPTGGFSIEVYMSHRTILPSDLSPIEANALLCDGVAPRPIALASTISADGVRNLSPFSFFNAFGSNPPTVAFAPNRRGRDGSVKHTYLNAVATGEFVIAAVSHAMLHQMNVASAEWPDGVDEFPKCGLTPVRARFVRPDLVAESPFQMECRLQQVVELGSGPGSGLLLIGEVLAFHVREDCFVNGVLHPDALDLVGRNGGAFYTRASGAAVFEVPKPVGKPVGYDALPEPLKLSRILTGNDLGQLANSPALPDLSAMVRKPGDPIAHAGIDHAIRRALAAGDLKEAWRLVGLRIHL